MRTTKVRRDKETGEYYLTLRSILYGTGVPVKSVVYYEYEQVPGQKSFSLKLFDKDMRQIKIQKKDIN